MSSEVAILVAFSPILRFRRRSAALLPLLLDPLLVRLSLFGARTLYDKIWDDHVVDVDGTATLLCIDRHLVHEVTSPQAFEGLRLASRGVRRPDCTLVTVDHNVPTTDRSELIDVKPFIEDTASQTQVMQLEINVKDCQNS